MTPIRDLVAAVVARASCRCERCGAAFRPNGDNANRFCSYACFAIFRQRPPEEIEAIRALWVSGVPAREIARRLKYRNKDVVIGLAHRNDFPRHPSAPKLAGYQSPPGPSPAGASSGTCVNNPPCATTSRRPATPGAGVLSP